MPRKKTHPLVGSDFEDFLQEEGRLGEATALAIKSVLAWELERAMKESNVSQAELARRMKTSRAVVHRLLDANDPSVTLATISKAATALGRSVRVALAA
jgi:predicted XRE-type DNA-binding protein